MRADTYTEISEKKTSKLGYLILIALFFFLIIIGQTVFSDISRIPERPVNPSYCTNVYLSDLMYITYKPACGFNEIDREFGLDALVNSLEPDLGVIIGYNNEIANKNNLAASNEGQLNRLLQQYGLSLQETIAKEEEVLLDKPEIKKQVKTLRANNENLKVEINELTARRDEAIQSITPKIEALKNSYSQAEEKYRTRLAYYNLKVFLLKLLFILPLFAISLYYYLKHKKRDSPYTIIITSVFYASTILFLQIILVFLYQILPKEWLARILKVLTSIPMLRYVIYYGVTILVILILGGLFILYKREFMIPAGLP